MAVTLKKGKAWFYFSPAFVSGCRDEELEGVIHHELLHMLFDHPGIDHSLYPNRHALTIAEEVTVNEHVPEPLPGHPLRLAAFPELRPREDTITRYHQLAERDDLGDRDHTIDMHALWNRGDAQGDSALDVEQMHHTLIRQLRRSRDREALHWALSGLGVHGGNGVIDDLCNPARPTKPVAWELVLSSTIGQRARREATFSRPPRRMPERIGVVPGTICRPEKPSLMAVIDTSSSMHRSHFERFRAELEQLRRLAEVTVVQCDKIIRESYVLRGPLKTIIGRGGTDLRPPLEPAVLQQHNPSLVLYFTDGDGPVPSCAPSVPVVWCLTAEAKSSQIQPPARWGKVVDLR